VTKVLYIEDNDARVSASAVHSLLCIAGCDKNKPGCLMGMALCNVPAIYVDAGTIKPGKWKGQDLTVVSAFEAVRAPCQARAPRI
jgi:dihydroxy-acid dehydratase